MPQVARIVAPGLPHHVTHRGNRRADVFAGTAAHCGLRVDPVLSADFPPAGATNNWSGWLAEWDGAAVEFIREKTRTGRPCGDRSFIGKLENILDRVLRSQKRGRKPKKTGEGGGQGGN
ncbi:MAG: hypothetical protein ABIH66_01835 [bacterium]